MQAHEGIGVDPVPTRRVAPVHQGDGDIAVVEQGVGKAMPAAPVPTTR